MTLTRRELVRLAGAAAVAAAVGEKPRRAAARERSAWRNWSGGQSCRPEARRAPGSEEELAALVGAAVGGVRPVGAGHSFSPLVPTDGTIVSVSAMSGLIGHDAQRLQAEFWAGTPMASMGEALKNIGQALPNMADIDYQTLAGATATSTHGTGPKYGSYSSQIVGLRLVTANGGILDCDAQHHPEVFRAARVSLGALGVLTRIRLQNRPAFRLHSRHWVQNTDELLEDMPRLVRENDHFEINPILHSDVSIASAQNETRETATTPKENGGDVAAVNLLRRIDYAWRDSPRTQAVLLNFLTRHVLSFPGAVDDSFRIFANVRDVRFNEMEYEVPAEAGVECLRAVIKAIRDGNLDSFIPLEFRYVKGDDIPLSMFQGRDSCAISVHQYYQMDYHEFFARVEPIFWRYGGRPHWGKLHTLNARLLKPLYPQWQDFQEVRQQLDPQGKFLNAHLRSIFGVTG